MLNKRLPFDFFMDGISEGGVKQEEEIFQMWRIGYVGPSFRVFAPDERNQIQGLFQACTSLKRSVIITAGFYPF